MGQMIQGLVTLTVRIYDRTKKLFHKSYLISVSQLVSPSDSFKAISNILGRIKFHGTIVLLLVLGF